MLLIGRLRRLKNPSMVLNILGHPGADSRGEGKSNRVEKYGLLFFVPYFSARLDSPSPPLSAPGSPRMGLDDRGTPLSEGLDPPLHVVYARFLYKI